MENAALITALVFFLALLSLYSSRRKKRRIESAFKNRESLSPELFYESYFKSQGTSFEVAAGVRQVLEEQLQIDMSRLKSTDDFTTNLSFLWDYDSLADVEIVLSLEERFGINITDEEVASARTVADLVSLVQRKVSAGYAA